MARIATVNFTEQVDGDTFLAKSVNFFIADGTTPLDLSDATPRIQIRKSGYNGRLVAELTIGDGIEWVVRASGTLQFGSISTSTWGGAGSYFYDLELTYGTSGIIRTYLRGEIKLIDDATGTQQTVDAVASSTIVGVLSTKAEFDTACIDGNFQYDSDFTGTPDGTKFLRDDKVWTTISGGGDALVANPLSQFAATTSAQLAGVISDETGTGVVVYNTSPTLITPDLGTPSALVGTNITGTAAGLTVGATTGVEAGADVTDAANVGAALTLTGDVTSSGSMATTIAAGAVDIAMLANGTDGELITWDATGVPTTVPVGTATHVLTSNGVGAAPTFQAAAGGGGTEYQIYERVINVDTTNTSNWCGPGPAGNFYHEWVGDTTVAATASMTTVAGGLIFSIPPIGVADGAQTVEYIKLWNGDTQSEELTKISIIKYKSTGSTLDSISVLYEDTIAFTDGSHITILAAAFTETAISDQDKIGLFFVSGNVADNTPVSFRLKCSID